MPWQQLNYCNADTNVVYNGITYVGNSVEINGLKYKASTTLDVDQQKITLSAKATDSITLNSSAGAVPFLQCVRNGILDGAIITRTLVFLPSWAFSASPIGGVVMFLGRVSTVDQVGRTSAEITVNSELTLLDIQMPRNLYGPNCNNIFGDPATCGKSGLTRDAFTQGRVAPFQYVGSGSTSSVINWTSSTSTPNSSYVQGTIGFLSGQNAGATVNIRSTTSSTLILSYPLQFTPATADQIVLFQGCDHTLTTCTNTYNNQANYRGFPYVPWQGAALSV